MLVFVSFGAENQEVMLIGMVEVFAARDGAEGELDGFEGWAMVTVFGSKPIQALIPKLNKEIKTETMTLSVLGV